MSGLVRANEVFVQEPRIRAQDGVEIGAWHHRARRGDLQHPEDGRRLRELLRLAGRRGKAAQRGRHPLNGLIQRGRLSEIDPGDPQVVRMREPSRGHLAALERARQLDVAGDEQITTISYYS